MMVGAAKQAAVFWVSSYWWVRAGLGGERGLQKQRRVEMPRSFGLVGCLGYLGTERIEGDGVDVGIGVGSWGGCWW